MPVQARDRATWRVFGVLMAGALVGVVGILPYVLTLLDRLPAASGTRCPHCGCCCRSNSPRAWF